MNLRHILASKLLDFPSIRVAGEAAARRLAKTSSYNIAPRRILVAGWERSRLQDMIQSFADSTPENSHVTFILKQVPEEPSPPGRWGSCRFSYLQSENPTSIKALMVRGQKSAMPRAQCCFFP